MKRSWNYLTILCIVTGLLFFAEISSVMASATSSRLMGNDRYLTAIDVSKEGWPEGAETVILTNGENFPDALSAASLAKKYNAPILLTEASRLNIDTSTELKRLKAKKVLLVGGEGVLSSELVKQLNLMGISSKRLAGQNRYDTSLAVAQEVGLGKGIFVLGGERFEDALAAAPIAAAQGMPILLIPAEELTVNQKMALNKARTTNVFLVGGESEFSDAVRRQFPTGEWITGADPYERNINLVTRFNEVLNLNTAYIATGTDFPDALAASGLAQKEQNPLFLLQGNAIPSSIRNFISNHVVSDFRILGGTGVISWDTENALKSISAQFTDFKMIQVKIQEKQKYELPKTVTMKKSTGEWEEIPVTWSLSYVSTLKAGTYQYEGRVKGYEEPVYLTLVVEPVPSKVTALTAEIVKGDSYQLPDFVTVVLSDDSVRQYPVTWSSNIVTLNKVGSYSFQGGIEGTSLKATLSLKVSEDSAINFNDWGLEWAVREEVNKKNTSQPIYKRDILKVTSLELEGLGISDLTGLENFTNLVHLDLEDNYLTSDKLAPLQKLTNLTYLNMEDNALDLITSIKALTQLTYLNVSDNEITDFTPLKGLTRLSTLYLSGNDTRDYSPVRLIYTYLEHKDFDL